MQIAAKKVSLDKCPYVSEEAKKALESAAQPPIRLVTIGVGDNKLDVGNETVMFRHEETFYHPTGIGFLIEDTLSFEELDQRISRINKLKFERVGQKIEVNLVAIKASSGNLERFVGAVEEVLAKTDLCIVLMSKDPELMKGALEVSRDRGPLVYAATKENFEEGRIQA
ncbi:unnamed protein product, partial [marine sediment metagenome]